MSDMDELATLHSLCGGKQRHTSRAAARIEVNEKNAATGRRHITFGCGFCFGFHVKVDSPGKARGAKKRATRRARYAAMGA